MTKGSTSNPDLSHIKISINQCYEDLKNALEQLCDAIRRDNFLPAQICNSSNNTVINSRDAVIKGICELFSKPGQQCNVTSRCVGLLGASWETLSLVNLVNEKKMAFKDSVMATAYQRIYPQSRLRQYWLMIADHLTDDTLRWQRIIN